jgi:hypothetical protein
MAALGRRGVRRAAYTSYKTYTSYKSYKMTVFRRAAVAGRLGTLASSPAPLKKANQCGGGAGGVEKIRLRK